MLPLRLNTKLKRYLINQDPTRNPRAISSGIKFEDKKEHDNFKYDY